MNLTAPFPYFGGKRTVVDAVWARLGRPKQYIEPFCGSAAILLAAPEPAALEVVNDLNGFIANFWRAVKHQPATVAEWADYPVSHVDLGGRHAWLIDQRARVGEALRDPNWHGDAQVAGWWLWGQCCWIGSGWAEWGGKGAGHRDQIPRVSRPGMGIHQIPEDPPVANAVGTTSAGRLAWAWLHKLSARLDRVRVIHGEWTRCLNHNHGGNDTAVFLDPPYRAYERLYGSASEPVADAVAAWALEHAHLRVAICGHAGDYHLPGWDVCEWSRGSLTYAGAKTTDKECIWYSPACMRPKDPRQTDMFGSLLGEGEP